MLARRLPEPYASRLTGARRRAAEIAESAAYRDFVTEVRDKAPFRFKADGPEGTRRPERFLRGVDHHLTNFVPKLLACLDRDIHAVFDFGCGSGSSSTSLAMVLPGVQCQGLDINTTDVSIAHQRAKLYGVEDRCRFDEIGEGRSLPFPDNHFDLCMCCSVLEYITDPAVRKTCIEEMARVLAPGGMLFMTVPNRIYPVEIHSGKLGWNYFPRLLKARMVGSHAWEIQRLARPHVLKWHNTPLLQLVTPWTNFALVKDR